CKQQQAWKPPVTRDEGVGQDGDQALPWGFYNPCRYHPCRVAPKPHGHGERLLSVTMAPLEKMVQVECNPRQVSCIFKQGEYGEKYGHGRKHHRHHPCYCPVYSKHQQPIEPWTCPEIHKQCSQLAFDY